MKTKARRYFSGLTPKRGFAKLFKELDVKLRELNNDLTHFIITDVANKCCGNITTTADSVRSEIAETLIAIKEYAMTDDELYVQERKQIRKALTSDPNYSDLGLISDAIKAFRR